MSERFKDFLARHIFHPLQGIALGDWWALLRRHRFSIDLRHSPRALIQTALSAANSAAARIERRRFGRRIEAASKDNMRGLAIEEGRVYVTASGVVEVYRADISNRRDLNSSQVLNVLRSVVLPGGVKSPTFHVNAKGERTKARWHHLDLCILLEEAYTNGYPSKNLERLLREQYGSEAEQIIEGLSK